MYIVNFTFDQVCQQNDGVAMESPLGSVIPAISMVKLETRNVPTLGNMVLNWKRFVHDTIGYVKNGNIDIILSKFISFHRDIQFTYEVEEENKLSFLDVLLIRNENLIETKDYQKPTNNDIYLKCKLFAPNTWKLSTLRVLIKRAYLIC